MKKDQGVPIPTLPKKPSPRKRNPVQMATDLAIKALMTKGISIRKVADVLGISPTTAAHTITRLKAQGDEVRPFLSAQRDEKLGRLVDHFMEKGCKLRTVRGSDALGAAKIYADRRLPLHSPSGAGGAVSITVVNISAARLPAAGPASTTTGGIQPPGHESGPNEEPA